MALNRLLPAPGIRSYQPDPEFGRISFGRPPIWATLNVAQ